MYDRKTATNTISIVVLMAGMFLVLIPIIQQQQQHASAQFQQRFFYRAFYQYSSTNPHYWLANDYITKSYDSSGNLINVYLNRYWYYNYYSFQGPWAFYGEIDYLVCSARSFSNPCANA